MQQDVDHSEMNACGRVRIDAVEFDFDRNVADGLNGESRVEPKIAQLLWVLVRRAGAVVNRDTLIEQVWDGAYGADQNLTNAISQLRKTLGEKNGEVRKIETVPKRGYRLVAEVSWVLPDDEAGPRVPNTAKTKNGAGAALSSSFMSFVTSETILKRIPLLTLCGLTAIILIAIGVRPALNTTRDQAPTSTLGKVDPASIAVLPFSNLSQESDQIFFSDGISEEILNALSNVEGLRVASRTSAFTFRNSDTLRLPEIAALLQVRYVVEGSVRRSGESIRITAQLIDAESDRQLWSKTFDQTLSAENIFATQNNIANAIVEELGRQFPVGDNGSFSIDADTQSLGAYDAFLEARDLFTNRNTVNLRRSITLFERAVHDDPDFARAWSGLAAAYQIAPAWVLLDRDYHKLAKQAAQRASALDDSLAMPYGVLAAGAIESNPADYQLAFDNYESAIAREPSNPTLLLWRAIAYVATGFFDRAESDLRACLRIDPASGICKRWLALTKLFAGEKDDAFRLFEDGAAHGERTHIGIFAKAYAAEGNRSAAIATWAWDFRGLALNTNRLYAAHVNADFDFSRESRAYEYEYQAATGKKLQWGRTGGIDATHTFKRYEDLVPYGWYPIWWLRMHDDFITSPHRKRLIREHGVFDYWQADGFPPQCRPLGDDDFECD